MGNQPNRSLGEGEMYRLRHTPDEQGRDALCVEFRNREGTVFAMPNRPEGIRGIVTAHDKPHPQASGEPRVRYQPRRMRGKGGTHGGPRRRDYRNTWQK